MAGARSRRWGIAWSMADPTSTGEGAVRRAFWPISTRCPRSPRCTTPQPCGRAGRAEGLSRCRAGAAFDTAFHRGHPFVNDTFALPRRFYEQGVRRYGFPTG